MIRTVLIAAIALTAAATAGCSFRPLKAEADPSPIIALDRAEQAREKAARSHPECRHGRADDKDYQRRCMEHGGAL
jgi:hypothetical protein